MSRSLICLAGVLSVLWLSGCGGGGGGGGGSSQDSSPAVVSQLTTISLQSDAGDYIGGGRSYVYSQANAKIAVSAAGGYLTIGITGDEEWNGIIQLPSGSSQLVAGSYAKVERVAAGGVAGLNWFGEGRACNAVNGSFVIDSAVYSGSDLIALDLQFDQHCEGAVPAFKGVVHWRASDKTAPPGPVSAPVGLWQPAAGTTPGAGNYVYLQSDLDGLTYIYSQTNATLALTEEAGHVSVSITGNETWFGDFKAMDVLSQLQAGYYSSLRHYPFHNPARGGLFWLGPGNVCNVLTGWFMVDSVSYSAGALTAIDLRFEQHCEGASAALRGKLHWVK